jgi:hypothetical protein
MNFIKNYWLNFLIFGLMLGALGWAWQMSKANEQSVQGREEALQAIEEMALGAKVTNDMKVDGKQLNAKEWSDKKAVISTKLQKEIDKQTGKDKTLDPAMNYDDLQAWFEMTTKEGCYQNLDNAVIIDWTFLQRINNDFKNNKC